MAQSAAHPPGCHSQLSTDPENTILPLYQFSPAAKQGQHQLTSTVKCLIFFDVRHSVLTEKQLYFFPIMRESNTGPIVIQSNLFSCTSCPRSRASFSSSISPQQQLHAKCSAVSAEDVTDHCEAC